MTRTVTRRPLTPISLCTRPRKRKGNSTGKKDLQHQDENYSDDVNHLPVVNSVNLNAIEQIANGVERMMSSWHLDTFERGRKQAKIIFAATNHEVQSSPDSPQADTVAPGPARSTHEKNVSCSIVETLTPIRQDEMSRGGIFLSLYIATLLFENWALLSC
jgi:hypothetical protein